MAKFISDEEMSKLEASQPQKKAFISDDEMSRLTKSDGGYDYSNLPKDLLQGQVDALPMYGQMAGSLLGPIVAGAGQAAGNSLKNGINSAVDSIKKGTFIEDNMRLPTFDQITGIADEAVDNFNQGVVLDSAGQVLGKGVQAAAPYAKKAIEPLADKFQSVKQSVGTGAKEMAERFSARAQGLERATMKKLGQERVQQIGRHGLDESVVTPFASTDDMISRNASAKARGGGMMDEVYSQIDEVGASAFNPSKAADSVESELGGFWRDPLNKGSSNQLDNTLEAIRMRAGGSTGAIPIKEAQALKETLGKAANWKNSLNPTDKEILAREAYGIVSKQIDEAVELGAQEIGSEGLLQTLKQGKKLYSNAKGSETLLENLAAKENGNKLGFGLTDTIMGAGALGYGGATDDWQTAGGVMLAKKGLEKYGAKTAAAGLDKISKVLMKSPQMAELSIKAPMVFQALAHQLDGKMRAMEVPKAAENLQNQEAKKPVDKEQLLKKVQGSKYGQVLQNAADRGDDAFNAAHFVLSQRDPNYRKQLEAFD